jgi:catechol 2,3-dioxygenase-like lactoylglutathione lyase family enzyme
MCEPVIHGVGQIHLTVTELDRAVRFSRDVLGLPLLFTVPAQEMAFFELRRPALPGEAGQPARRRYWSALPASHSDQGTPHSL